jgi:hypothetical protein
LAWLLASLLPRDPQTLAMSIRWLLAIPWALALLELGRDSLLQRRFLWGMVGGFVANLLVVVLQAAGLEQFPRAVGFSPADSAFYHFVFHSLRIPGLHGHPNASSAVISLIVPVSLLLYFGKRVGIWLPIAGLVGLLATLNLTSSRSPLGVSLVTLLAATFWARRPQRGLVLVVTLVALMLPLLLFFGPPGGKVRWQDMAGTEANLSERVKSNNSAFQISLENPLGLGVKAGHRKLIEHGGIVATHNAFLQTSLFLGIPTALGVFFAFVHLMWRTVRGPGWPGFWAGIFAWHLFGLFLFEEHLNNPTFIILTNWLLASSVMNFGGQPVPSATERVAASHPTRAP